MYIQYNYVEFTCQIVTEVIRKAMVALAVKTKDRKIEYVENNTQPFFPLLKTRRDFLSFQIKTLSVYYGSITWIIEIRRDTLD